MAGEHFLVIMAKEPLAGKVKTRLQPRFSPKEAAEFYSRCLLDTIDNALRVAGTVLAIAYSPPSAITYFSGIAKGAMLLRQPRGDLGTRLSGLTAGLLARGAESVTFINSDGPDLPVEYLVEAVNAARKKAELILGPCPDGGYYLVGLRRPEDIFRGIPWSTSEVMTATLGRAKSRGLAVHILPPWPDIDTWEDLIAAWRRWRDDPHPPRRTFAFIKQHAALAGIHR